ncbi:MBL fold metallo-hydrolase [Methanocella sp. CWC-04]|uniref:Metallo-beta-lactamase domain-containing protein 1 n=1 Tax=Methanooceanicella nereidis TaxID=2052831 RepID=A0AAP2RDN9_9EURY|nr:MBL fold metallo-hydrolase [Methanocella sp. CWC-04]MCD1295714.1 MBL fold metallo-hydrolase [Methanocella sp. CWC-04]
MPVKTIKVIKQGSLPIDGFEEPDPRLMAFKNLAGVGGGSTVTYIESDVKIIVDTGFDFDTHMTDENVKQNKKNLTNALKSFGLKPSDIDILFITHWHLDHFGNYKLFRKSKILTYESAVDKCRIKVTGVKDGESIADGVRVMHTPGHTSDHASLLVETDRLRYSIPTSAGGRIVGIGELKIAVAGDAILSPIFYAMNKTWTNNRDFYSNEAAGESRNKLTEYADYIIPGHGNVFRNVIKDRDSQDT